MSILRRSANITRTYSYEYFMQIYVNVQNAQIKISKINYQDKVTIIF